MTKISVCIPVYGVEKYIERCARSLFEQTMTEGIEYIFVNDCTPDRSIEILEKLLDEYPERKKQTKILHHEVNSGLVAARKTALKNASGDYIIHCDSDDWVDLNMYEIMYNEAARLNADVVIASYILEYANGKQDIFNVIPATTPGEYLKNNSRSNFNTLATKLYRKEIVLAQEILCPNHIHFGEDLLRNIQMLSRCKTVVSSPDVYYHYFRANTSSITRLAQRNKFWEFHEAVLLLKDYNFDSFPHLQLLLKGSVLFAALKITDLKGKEYRKLFSKDTYWKVLLTSSIPLWKRILLGFANISYRGATQLCRCLLFLKAKSGE